jgi:hypothetical protein
MPAARSVLACGLYQLGSWPPELSPWWAPANFRECSAAKRSESERAKVRDKRLLNRTHKLQPKRAFWHALRPSGNSIFAY